MTVRMSKRGGFDILTGQDIVPTVQYCGFANSTGFVRSSLSRCEMQYIGKQRLPDVDKSHSGPKC